MACGKPLATSNSKWKRVRQGLSLMAFVCSACLGWVLLDRFDAETRQRERGQTGEVAATFALSVERVLEQALSATRSLAAMVYQGHGHVPDFTVLARFLLPLYKGAYALSLAPDGIIRQIEPLDRNLLLRDHDLLEDENRDEILRELLAGKETRIEFVGPLKLIQGPIGAVGRLPVLLPDAHGQTRFWGYTAVTLVLPEALADANLAAIVAQGYAYQLTGIDPQTGERRVLQRSAEELADGICRDVRIEATTWKLCVAPLSRWQNQARHYFDASLVVLGSGGVAWLVYGVLGRRERRAELLRQALFDPLTGLANRRLLEERLLRALERSRRQETLFAVVLLDLDGFKAVNDRFGHAQGDYLLIATAQRLLKEIRSVDTLARLGGDEFVLIMENVPGRDECERLLERLLHVVREPLPLEGGLGQVYASIGVVITDGAAADDSDAVLRRADAAMYRAKHLGKNRYVIV
ncbi:diguanylate cyclase domain-containing protein [Pseudomonas benzopyrenica]|uniref:GGDEF domain-containing protein n=1 Tax=Pseudomonas benzopyrenica TaxID=2993566 RepID=UPI003F15AAE7